MSTPIFDSIREPVVTVSGDEPVETITGEPVETFGPPQTILD